MRYESFRQNVIDRLKELALEQNLSINKLCKKSRVSSSMVYNFLKDPNSSLTINTLHKLCIGLGTDFNDFFDTPKFK